MLQALLRKIKHKKSTAACFYLEKAQFSLKMLPSDSKIPGRLVIKLFCRALAGAVILEFLC
jgi:hypothetical protein